MENVWFFRTIYSDTRKVEGLNTSFFIEDEDNSNSVRELVEQSITEWMLKDLGRRNLFLETFFEDISQVKIFTEVKEPITNQNKKPGDIDILMIHPDYPEYSIACECKRVIVEAIDEGEARINGSHNIVEGIHKIKKYKELGFHKNYLIIYSLHDGRRLKTPNVLFRTSRAENVKKLYHIPWNEPLDNDIGMIFIEIQQLTGRSYNLTFGFGICHAQDAQRLEQPQELTNRIKSFLKYKS